MTEYVDMGGAELDRQFSRALVAEVDRVLLAAMGHSTPASPRTARDWYETARDRDEGGAGLTESDNPPRGRGSVNHSPSSQIYGVEQ